MGMIKVSSDVWFAPPRGWTKAQYDAAQDLRDLPVLPRLPTHAAGPVAALVAALGAGAPWQADALCKEYPGVEFFSDNSAPAKAICERCLVRDECLDAGDSGRELGVWGATTAKERARLRRANVA